MEPIIGLTLWVLGVATVIVLATIGLIEISEVLFDNLRAWVKRRGEDGKITYHLPENRFTKDQAVKAYQLTHDEWIFKHCREIYDWNLLLIDVETSRVLAVSTGEDDVALIRKYLKEAPKHEIPLERRRLVIVPIQGFKNP